MSMLLGVLLLFRMGDEPPATGTVLVMRGNAPQRAAAAGVPGKHAATDAPDDDRPAHAADRAGTGETRPAAASGSAPSHRPPRRQPLRSGADGVKVAAASPAQGLADGPAGRPGANAVNEPADGPTDELAGRRASASLLDGAAARGAADGC